MKAPPTGARKNVAPGQKDPPQQPSDRALIGKVNTLHGLTAQQLRDEWPRLYRNQPPRLSRDLLIRSLAYRIQEMAHGGLSKATHRKLTRLTRELTIKGAVTIAADVQMRPGARLVREWHGRTHTIIVRDDGFEFNGKNYPSLTRIAHLITGAHWSGPRFFGLNRKPTMNGHETVEPAGFAGLSEAIHG